MKTLQGTAIIRDRGQLTIPEKMREVLKWSSTNSVVSLYTTEKGELLIKPFVANKEPDWDTIWANIERSRSYKGKNGNLSKFISLDRESH